MALIILSLTALLWAPAQQPALWLDVPFVEQVKNGCGAACIAMVMGYWDRQAPPRTYPRPDPREIYQTLYVASARGILASDLEKYLVVQGFRVFPFRGEWSDLERHLSKGRPLIACLRESRTLLHYVVVAGIDPSQQLVYLNDPARRKLLKQRRADFEKAWKGGANYALLAIPE